MELRFPGNLLPQLLTRPAQAERVTGMAAVQTLLQLGQQFSATVVERQGGGQYLLEVYQPGVRNGTMLRAMSVTALEPGQALRLEVVDNGPPPQLRILPPPEDDIQETISQALRQFLPKQEDLHGVMERLSRFAARGEDAGEAKLPQTLREALRSVLGALPDKGALSTAEGLKRAIENSGLFLEARLAQQVETAESPQKTAPPSLAQDMKATLLKLADGLSARLSSLEEAAPRPESEADAVLVFPRPAPPAAPSPGANAPPTRLAAAPPEAAPIVFPSGGAPLGEDEAASPPAPPLAGAPLASKGETVADGRNPPPLSPPAETAEEAAPSQAAPHPHAAAGQRPAPESAPPPIQAPREGEQLKELLSKTESALAKIVLDQLASAPQPNSTAQSWRLELPFHNQGRSETASLQISREGGQRAGREAEANPSSWSVTLELNPPGLGALHSRLVLYQGEVSGVFWSERPATAELVREHLERLDARLRAAGLKTGQLNAAVGAPPEPSSSQPRPRLLDERA
jgi:hypothetical protein